MVEGRGHLPGVAQHPPLRGPDRPLVPGRLRGKPQVDLAGLRGAEVVGGQGVEPAHGEGAGQDGLGLQGLLGEGGGHLRGQDPEEVVLQGKDVDEEEAPPSTRATSPPR